jgi:hypothetical protein
VLRTTVPDPFLNHAQNVQGIFFVHEWQSKDHATLPDVCKCLCRNDLRTSGFIRSIGKPARLTAERPGEAKNVTTCGRDGFRVLAPSNQLFSFNHEGHEGHEGHKE